jgi:hypothetical protein
MKKTKTIVLSVVFLCLLVSTALFSATEETLDKSFEAKDEVRFKLVLGDCQLKKSTDGRIHVNLVYSYKAEIKFEPIMEIKGSRLILEEKYRGKSKNNNGYSKWTVAVPDEIEIDFESATGSLNVDGLNLEIEGSTGTGEIELSNVKGEFDVSSGTGNVDVKDSEGEFEVSSGTGNVDVKDSEGEFEVSSGTGNVDINNSKGNFEASSGTGNVRADGITLDDEGNFSSGTGDAEVVFPEGTDFELNVSSGTNDAELNMKGKPIEGYFEFKCHARRGRIDSPIKFDEEKEYEEGDQKYLQKSFTKGNKSIRVYISTGTGKAKLKK